MKLLVPTVLAALLILHAQAARDENARWDSRFALPGVDGGILSMAFNHRQIVLGGSIKSIGRVTNDSGVAMFDGKRWKSLRRGPTQNPPEIGVIGVESFRNRLYACGYFTDVSGLPTCGFARWNGQRWSNPAGTNGMVNCLRTTPQGLLVGGQFEVPGVGKRVALARYNGRRWTVLMLSTVVSDDTHLSTVSQCEQLDSGEIIATDGGRVLRYDGTQWSPLLLPNGSVQGFGSYELTQFHGQLIAVNSEWSGSPSPQAVYSWNGHVWQKLGDNFDEILGAAGNGRVLFAAHRVGPAVNPRHYAISQWTGTNWQRLGTNLFFTDYARVFISPQDRPYVTGTFPGFPPVAAAGLIRWNGRQWESPFKGTYEGVNGIIHTVLAIAKHSDGIYMGGIFSAAGRLNENSIARWDGRHWQSVGGGLSGFPAQHVRALTSADSLLFAAGRFTNIGGISVSNVAAWNGTQWSALGTGLRNDALAMTMWNGSVVVGGKFEQAGDATARHVARWDGTNWQALGEGCNSNVTALASWRGELFAGGEFTLAGGSNASSIARWNGSEWRDVGGGVSGDYDPDDPFLPRVRVIATSPENVYVAGEFQTAGGVAATNLARWDGTNWHALAGWTNNSDVSVSALAVRGEKLYVGARRNTGRRGPLLLCWNGSEWTEFGSGISDPADQSGSFGQIYTLLSTDKELFVGGRFPWAGGKASANVARWIEKPPGRR